MKACLTRCLYKFTPQEVLFSLKKIKLNLPLKNYLTEKNKNKKTNFFNNFSKNFKLKVERLKIHNEL